MRNLYIILSFIHFFPSKCLTINILLHMNNKLYTYTYICMNIFELLTKKCKDIRCALLKKKKFLHFFMYKNTLHFSISLKFYFICETFRKCIIHYAVELNWTKYFRFNKTILLNLFYCIIVKFVLLYYFSKLRLLKKFLYWQYIHQYILMYGNTVICRFYIQNQSIK